jgi:septal ring factor EnvC (AmiA/AmiB activator)
MFAEKSCCALAGDILDWLDGAHFQMTPEERWIKIENALQAVAENQAAHDARMAQIEAALARTEAALARTEAALARTEAVTQKNAEATEKNADGIRELIRLNGAYVQWQKDAEERFNRALERIDSRFDQLTQLLKEWFRTGGNGRSRQ